MGRYRPYDDIPLDPRAETGYALLSRRRRRMVLAGAAAALAAAVATVFVSNLRYGAFDALVALFTFDTGSRIGRYVWNIDMPVLTGAFLQGAGLSLAGTVMQCILRNPLASPYTLGLSNAAAFGAQIQVIFGGGLFTGTVLAQFVTPLLAFAMAMAATGGILLLVRATSITSESMVLAGIAVSAIFQAGLTFMQYMADSAQLSQIVSWMFGSVQHAAWSWDAVLFVAFVLMFLYCRLNRWTLNAMEQGDDVAKGLGVNTDRFLVAGLTVSALLSALIVSQFGIIAFVGLLGPHMARILVGSDHRYLVPMSVLVGGFLLTAANMVAANLFLPAVLPVGLLTALLGGPAFIYLLIRRYAK